MGAPNFARMNFDMPLVVGGYADYNECKKAYEEETGEEYDEFLYELDIQFNCEYAEEVAEEINNTLIFHKVTIQSGRYSGFQFFVDEIHSDLFDLDKNSEYCIDNEDAHYYFDMCKSRALRAADAEKRKIDKWLAGLENRGFERLVCVAVFSNGEAVYQPYTERAEMIAVARGAA